jgi:PAS domain S-box-containing protein
MALAGGGTLKLITQRSDVTIAAGAFDFQEQAEISNRVKILLVDDTPENLVSLEAALDTLGEELVLAQSGKEALRYLLDDNFAAILLDVKMPDMDGFETAELIRSRARSRHTPILFLTGYRSDEHLFRGYHLGAVDFLFKPIVPEILRSKVAVFVELSRKAELLQQQTTALVEQAATLHQAEQRFRSLLEAAPDAMVICRETGEIILVNSRTELLFGYPREDLLNQHIRLLVPAWSYELFAPAADDSDDSFFTIGGASRELKAVRHDGSVFPIEITLSPLEIDEGLLITSAIRDITWRRRAEEERGKAEEQARLLYQHLEELNAHLEERVVQRTEELLRSNEELAQFAYVASHDLQEPLRTVSVYTQLLAKRYAAVLQGEARHFMDYIMENAQRMEHLIHDLLDFSRVDGRRADYFTLVACDDAVDEAIMNLKARIEETGTVIERDPLPCVQGDPIQLTRLFQNLTINSIKYSKPAEPPRIHISATRSENEWLISIKDNGIGIEPQYAEKVFGIFKRLHGRENPGTGMGLAICKKIVNRHGGRIWVESELDAGATFRFTLPACETSPKIY